MMRFLVLLLGLFLSFTPSLFAGENDAKGIEFFEKQIRPVLIKHCYSCHSTDAEKQKKLRGELFLDSKSGWRTGGESGPTIVPGDPNKSLLIRALKGDGVKPMPPKETLPKSIIQDFEKWVEMGAPDPRTGKATSATSTIDFDKARQHWAFQLPKSVLPPTIKNIAWVQTPIDRFILAKLEEKGLSPTPAANRPILARRLYFDLTGLPPTPEEMQKFLNDPSPNAVEKLIDQLLASPAYGEKWGRYWLDIVRYADTAGETADFPVPQVYRYRNYVIDAFNRDKPFDHFVREQIAGDILAKTAPKEKSTELITATGYLAIARRFGFDVLHDHFLTIEDTIDTLGKSILGLTIGCARCHDHKYDPILATDYYALYGIFESTRYPHPGCEKEKRQHDFVALLPSDEQAQRIANAKNRLTKIDQEIQKLREQSKKHSQNIKEVIQKSATKLAAGEFNDGKSASFDTQGKEQEVRIGDAILLKIHPQGNHGGDTTLIELEISEIGNPKRTWSVTADVLDNLLSGNPHGDRVGNANVWAFMDLQKAPVLLSESIPRLQGQLSLHVWRNGDTPSALVNAGKEAVRVWTTLPPRSFFVHPGANGPVGVAWISPIAGKVTVKGRIVDVHPGGPDGVGWQVDLLKANLLNDFQKLGEQIGKLGSFAKERAELEQSISSVEMAYAVVEGKPHDAQSHKRGDPENRGEFVPRRWLQVMGGQAIPKESGSGRLALADWLTDSKNPLTARVIVNRIWQGHFGNGLVSTPNDFGTRGTLPSHPELLDYLAQEFVQNGWSIKKLHREILLSAVYQQSVDGNPTSFEKDANNTWLSRFSRRRLTAEEIRDSILAVCGDLDRTPAGKHPFPDEKSWGFTQHTPFSAVYDHDRRSVYLMTQRIKRHPFLALFDGADPNSSTPHRDTTTVPTQSLFFMNDPFIHNKSNRLAERLLALPDDATRLDHLYQIGYGRSPTSTESALATRFLAKQPNGKSQMAWASWIRVMLASNEFLYVD